MQDVKDTPRRIVELSSGPGLFAQMVDPDKVHEVELIDMSGESRSLTSSADSSRW